MVLDQLLIAGMLVVLVLVVGLAWLIIAPWPPGLEQAMGRKMVIVHETNHVNELAIENVSSEEVFVQAGDIVKGGRQDRVLAVDLILPAKSGEIPIDAFCVESGRWQKRGNGEAGKFSSSNDRIVTKELKIAANATRPATASAASATASAERRRGRGIRTIYTAHASSGPGGVIQTTSTHSTEVISSTIGY